MNGVIEIPAPSLAQRVAVRKRPRAAPVGRQRWNHFLFAHWKVPAVEVQASLPPGLFVDTHEGDAYVAIVPFFMQRVRPVWFPPLPWVSWFLELNVRTYVYDASGRPGVWFYSLDCNQPVAVAIARRFFHLPYFHARMQAQYRDGTVQYHCHRRALAAAPARYVWKPGPKAAPAQPGTLEFFLLERYALYTADRAGQLYHGRVHHPPYQVHVPEASEISSEPARQAGFALAGDPVSVLGTLATDVSIFPLQRVPAPRPARRQDDE